MALGRPSPLHDQEVVDGQGIEGPEQVAGLLDRQVWPQRAPIGQQPGEAAYAVEPFLLDLSPELGQLGVGGGRADQDPQYGTVRDTRPGLIWVPSRCRVTVPPLPTPPPS